MKLTFLIFAVAGWQIAAADIQSWTTTENLERRMSKDSVSTGNIEQKRNREIRIIEIDRFQSYQTILGMGASFEHSTCSNLFRVTPEERERAIELLVSRDRGAGMNLMRICIGTSDFAGEAWYSYDDRKEGEVDPDLQKFSIKRDQPYVLPVLKIARKKNPALLFFASPWSPPGWMKTTGTMIGGKLLPKYYRSYAQYFVRFIQAYEAEDIPIYAVTVQNEPGVDRAKDEPKMRYPSCHWTGEEERNFIRDYLGPAVRKAGLKTKIWCYDHNYNIAAKNDSAGLDHPRTILSDARASEFVDGVGFHHYEGQPSGMTVFHQEFPNKPIHFTEGSVFGIDGARDLVERFRNWAVSYNAWVALLDEAGRPNNGPFPATIAILRLNSKTQKIEQLFEYYLYAHFSEFVRRGAKRIFSTIGSAEFSNIAFQNPDGSICIVLVNTMQGEIAASLQMGTETASTKLPPKSIQTLLWGSANN